MKFVVELLVCFVCFGLVLCKEDNNCQSGVRDDGCTIPDEASLNRMNVNSLPVFSDKTFETENSTDIKNTAIPQNKDTSDFEKDFNSNDINEYFDYLWIRIRILVFVVSIYVLEMM